MGGTDENNFLNTIGKDKDGKGNGDILIWKRKAEKYLVEVSRHIVLVCVVWESRRTLYIVYLLKTYCG